MRKLGTDSFCFVVESVCRLCNIYIFFVFLKSPDLLHIHSVNPKFFVRGKAERRGRNWRFV